MKVDYKKMQVKELAKVLAVAAVVAIMGLAAMAGVAIGIFKYWWATETDVLYYIVGYLFMMTIPVVLTIGAFLVEFEYKFVTKKLVRIRRMGAFYRWYNRRYYGDK